MELFIFFILKLLDNFLSTIKNLLLIKNKNILSSLANATSQFFYLIMMVKISKNSSTIGVIIICTATFIGSLLPQLMFDKISKDKVFVFNIIPETKDHGKELADELRKNNIAIQTYTGFNDNKEKILCIKAFSESKNESVLLEQLIPSNCKYHIIELKNYIQN